MTMAQERPNDDDDNDGLEYGFYVFDCEEEDYEPEFGYGSYDILEAFWYATESERNIQYEFFK
jgi:hypothetical protein